MDDIFFEPICLYINELSIKIDINPETSMPSSKNGAISTQRAHISEINSIMYVIMIFIY